MERASPGQRPRPCPARIFGSGLTWGSAAVVAFGLGSSQVIFAFVYVIVRSVLGLLVVLFRRDLSKDAELLVLRHENAVQRCHVGRVRYEPVARAWLAALARLIPRRRWSEVFPVTPATLLDLAPQADGEEVRHEQAAQARSPADGPEYRPPCRSPGRGESAVET